MPIRLCSRICFVLSLAVLAPLAIHARVIPGVRSSMAPIPSEVSSTHFTVTVGGVSSPVMHAVSGYYLFNFEIHEPTTVTVTADDAHYWDTGVEVQPWSLGIRPQLQGHTISLTLSGPAKISITRPGDHLAGAEMLFLFANTAEKDPPVKTSAGVRYYGPGVYRENIDAKSGDNIYLADGAVIFGGLNLWDVDHVRVFGRGTIIYDGPQDPDHDEGWKNQKNWHVIGMHDATDISIEGITCVVRSRTWMIQMRDSRHVLFDNVKVIGGSKGNANQDGMDWLGGGDAVVRNSFFRAADDIFAMYGNWDGYTPEALTTPGHEVDNITIEDSVLSTSISNVVRVGWPRKIFDSRHFVMRNTDVIHMGMGGCGVPFALFEIWADPGGKGDHSDYLFENIRMDNWYSLVQLRQPNPGIHNVRFRDISGLETPSMVQSVLLGAVDGVTFDGVKLGGRVIRSNAEMPLELKQSAAPPDYSGGNAPIASFAYDSGMISPGRDVKFEASSSGPPTNKIVSYEWSFGDGGRAAGSSVHHAFTDTSGTLWDRSGRYRVLLKTTDAGGRSAWAYEPVVVTNSLLPAVKAAAAAIPGLGYHYYESGSVSLPSIASATAVASGISPTLEPSLRKRPEDYGVMFDGFIDIPADGGYTFTLLSTDEGEISIDSTVIARSPKPLAQVCGLVGNAVQSSSGSIGLAAGKHAFHVAMTHTKGSEGFAVLWQGRGIAQSAVPASALFHSEK
jgi:hypothetical protein